MSQLAGWHDHDHHHQQHETWWKQQRQQIVESGWDWSAVSYPRRCCTVLRRRFRWWPCTWEETVEGWGWREQRDGVVISVTTVREKSQSHRFHFAPIGINHRPQLSFNIRYWVDLPGTYQHHIKTRFSFDTRYRVDFPCIGIVSNSIITRYPISVTDIRYRSSISDTDH